MCYLMIRLHFQIWSKDGFSGWLTYSESPTELAGTLWCCLTYIAFLEAEQSLNNHCVPYSSWACQEMCSLSLSRKIIDVLGHQSCPVWHAIKCCSAWCHQMFYMMSSDVLHDVIRCCYTWHVLPFCTTCNHQSLPMSVMNAQLLCTFLHMQCLLISISFNFYLHILLPLF